MTQQESSITTLDDDEDNPNHGNLNHGQPDDEAQDEHGNEHIAVADHGDRMCGRRMELVLHAGEGEAGRQAAFIGINTHGFNIPRSVKVSVPVEVVEIIENATMTIYEQIGEKIYEREVKRFSYTARPLPNPASADKAGLAKSGKGQSASQRSVSGKKSGQGR
jgi:hypothetical protein